VRIRSIKPEFWRSEDISSLVDWNDRFIFIGLWSYVDDNGVGVDRLSLIATDLFADDVERDPSGTFARVSRGLQNLSEAGRIVRYSVGDKAFLAISNWDKHQRIDKPNKPRYPLPTSENAEIRESVASISGDLPETPAPGTGEQGNRGTGEEEIPSPQAAKPAEPARFLEFWNTYPRRQGRGEAIKSYARALKKIDADTLIDAARNYANDPNRDPGFTAMAATWLNQERWQDDPLPARGNGKTNPTQGAMDILAMGQQLLEGDQHRMREIH
jgi:hypothetical protein